MKFLCSMESTSAYTVLTGSTSGIGKETARALAKKGIPLILPVRNTDKGKELKNELQSKTDLIVLPCDLGSLKSVNNCISDIKQLNVPVDRIINNAGGIWMEKSLSADGYERSFAVNHLAHFQLTKGLLSLLQKTEDPRVINLSSGAHALSKTDLSDPLFKDRKYNGMTAYADSKLYNILFTRQLYTLHGSWLFTAAVHPGVVATAFSQNNKGWVSRIFRWMGPFILSPAKGAKTSLYCALEAPRDLNGLYWTKSKPARSSKEANDPRLAEKLWEVSESLLEGS